MYEESAKLLFGASDKKDVQNNKTDLSVLRSEMNRSDAHFFPRAALV